MTVTGLAPTATAVPTEATPEPLLNAKYVYDGDGNMVTRSAQSESVETSTLNTTTTTYYPGNSESQGSEGNDGEDPHEVHLWWKYYSAGGTTVAVRTVTGGNDTLQWLISDNLVTYIYETLPPKNNQSSIDIGKRWIKI
jgi:hypothetical protein